MNLKLFMNNIIKKRMIMIDIIRMENKYMI